MATTPNYGWVTPAPTNFVTDLPADFEVFADAVDGDLSGLLGGTTGQVLVKDSNADHDYAWSDDVIDLGTDISDLNDDLIEVKTTVEINAQTGTTYTLVLADAGKLITSSNASPVTITVPPNDDVAFPVGTRIDVLSIGAGLTTLAQGSGVTISSKDSLKKLSKQGSAGSLIKVATNTWWLVGDLSA
jgi:hypothetical protein